MREVADSIELAGTLPDVNVLPEEYVRLLGYPRGWVLEGRARELADWARDWYARERPAVVLCAAGGELRDSPAIRFIWMELQFSSKRLESTLRAGGSAQRDSGRRWRGP